MDFPEGSAFRGLSLPSKSLFSLAALEHVSIEPKGMAEDRWRMRERLKNEVEALMARNSKTNENLSDTVHFERSHGGRQELESAAEAQDDCKETKQFSTKTSSPQPFGPKGTAEERARLWKRMRAEKEAMMENTFKFDEQLMGIFRYQRKLHDMENQNAKLLAKNSRLEKKVKELEALHASKEKKTVKKASAFLPGKRKKPPFRISETNSAE